MLEGHTKTSDHSVSCRYGGGALGENKLQRAGVQWLVKCVRLG